ncbi:hypothetical protein CpB0976 [Chlamydia pneumoniae TW-183]|uniref:Uncharacterized protein n=1 Tax=Chlamydia pneumoniae TaxID=83558 RepID=A0ABN3YQG9_CHLPN|nr:hypothetical protein CpB0976 [Chlamydia pneumoniae TW-183]
MELISHPVYLFSRGPARNAAFLTPTLDLQLRLSLRNFRGSFENSTFLYSQSNR